MILNRVIRYFRETVRIDEANFILNPSRKDPQSVHFHTNKFRKFFNITNVSFSLENVCTRAFFFFFFFFEMWFTVASIYT